MPERASNRQDRLDSWKAIAGYLNRTERTVRRWEQELRLPVRRVPGGRGRSVFAYKFELDRWLNESQRQPASDPASTDGEERSGRIQTAHRVGIAVTLAMVVTGLGWRAMQSSAHQQPVRVDFTPSAIVALDAAGSAQWRYEFQGERVALPNERRDQPVEILQGDRPAIVAATALQVSASEEVVRGGQLFSWTPQGELTRTFSFDDRLTFGAGVFGPPWGITDFRIDERMGTRRVAVAAHHFQWWPSMVVILDDTWRRRGTFVHAGWIERVHWLSPDRLLVAGFSEEHDGGVVALLDATHLDGQSPSAGQAFSCTSCGLGGPLRYVVMPRSEVNRAMPARFNRARLELSDKSLVVRTIEVAPDESAAATAADALYEFTPSLELISASFSARYWDVHRALEADGKLDHTRAECPDRDGPREIHVWEPPTGWTTRRIR